MPADSKINFTEDGFAEVGMTDARAVLTKLVREVRYGGKIGALTERKVRQVILVTPDFYDRAVAALGEDPAATGPAAS